MKAKLLIGICTVVCLNMFGQANSTEYFPIGTSWQEAYYVIYYDTIKKTGNQKRCHWRHHYRGREV